MNFLKKINTYKSLLIIVSITFLVIRLISLGFDHTNNDSIRWFIRSENFLQAVKDGNFSETYQKYHPGVTLMLVNSFFKQGFYFYQYNFTDYKLDLLAWNIFPYLNLFSKLTVILLIFGVILLQTSLIRKLWSEKTALFYFFFISIEPYFVGINRWFHLTSFEVIFGFTAVLYILYWLKNRTYQNLAFSSIFLALAVLTKVTSVVIGPVILIILVSWDDFRIIMNKFLWKK
jgi:hypothetical protein